MFVLDGDLVNPKLFVGMPSRLLEVLLTIAFIHCSQLFEIPGEANHKSVFL